MPFFDPIRIGASGAADDFTVDRSLRFNDGDSPNLARTPSGDGNKKKWTWSSWIKISANGTLQTLFSVRSGNRQSTIFLKANGQLQYFSEDSGGTTQANLKTDALLRDPSAWYHVVVHLDAANTTGKIYLNGVEQSLEVSTAVVNTDHNFNTTLEHLIGNEPSQSNYFDGYMAEVNFIDGQALTPSSFAETNSTTGQWNPKDTSGLTFGTNGFRLQFADNSGTTATTLGKDTSGNGHNFTPNNFSVSAGENNDSVEDTPTNNWCTLNPLDPDAKTLSEGNLKCVGSTGFMAGSNFIVTSGKWYMEVKYVSGTSNHQWSIGFSSPDRSYLRLVRGGDGELTPNTGTVAVTFADPDVIMVALDVDNGKWYIGKNGSYMLSGDPVNGTGFVHSGLSSSEGFMLCMINNTGDGSQTIAANFGQQGFTYTPPTDFKALNSANLPDPTILLPNNHFNTVLYTGNSSNGHAITGVGFQPDWTWIKARTDVRTHSLIDAVRGAGKILSSNNTNAEYTDATAFASFDSDGFTVGTSENYINNSSHTYVGWNWNAGDTDGKTYTVKVVDDSGNKYRFDDFGTSAVTLDLAEGGTYVFDQSDSSNATHPLRFYTAADKTGGEYTTGVTTAGTPGSSGAYTQIVVAASAPTLYYQCSSHAGMGGQVNTNSTLGSSNFDGTIQSTCKVNASAGFSIVTYTGNGTGGATIGHGLGVTPQVTIIKNRTTSSRDWIVNHPNLTSGKVLFLNSTSSELTNGGGTPTTFTSTTIRLDSGSSGLLGINHSSDNYVMYTFSEVAGYSKFGSYTGNGSTDGVFVHLGFKPAWVMVKRSSATSASSGWLIFDKKRNTFNQVSNKLAADSSQEENDASTIGSPGANDVDFLSNGFKTRAINAGTNVSGDTYIYLAFAEAPFRNARAR